MTFRAILFLTLFAATATAQIAPTANLTTSEATANTHQFPSTDTILALQRLFERHRKRGDILIGITGLSAVGAVILFNNNKKFSFTAPESTIARVGITVIFTAPFWIIGTYQLIKFSKKKEENIIYEFTSKHSLPQRIRRKLKFE
jgi:hypothetical protein